MCNIFRSMAIVTNFWQNVGNKLNSTYTGSTNQLKCIADIMIQYINKLECLVKIIIIKYHWYGHQEYILNTFSFLD